MVFTGLLVAVCAGAVQPRQPEAAAPHLRVRGDSLQYVAMIEGRPGVQAPFGYRLAVPTLARWLPLPPLQALQLITLGSVWLGLVALWLALRSAGFGVWSSVGALLCLSASPAQLALFHNPYLTDGAGWALICLAVLAVVRERLSLFAGAVLVGVSIREASLFVAPAWLALEPRRVRAWGVLVAGIGMWLGLRGWVGPLPQVVTESRPLLRIIGDAAVTWHAFWVLGVVGLLGWRRVSVGWVGALLLAGAGVSSAFATDTGRMFAILGPVLVLGVAWCLQALRQLGSRLGAALVGATVAASVIWFPMVFAAWDRMASSWRPWRAAALSGMAAAVAACLWTLWRARQAGRLTAGGRGPPVF